MSKLYGLWDEIPADIADEVLNDDIPAASEDDPDGPVVEPGDEDDE